MADKTWKRVEREKCRALGGERSGPTGRDTPDCDENVKVGLEIKAYKKFVFLTADWRQAKENAKKVSKIPALNVRESGRGGRDCVQMCELDWFMLETIVSYEPDELLGFEGPPPRLLEHDGDAVVRMGWDYFVALYRAAFND